MVLPHSLGCKPRQYCLQPNNNRLAADAGWRDETISLSRFRIAPRSLLCQTGMISSRRNGLSGVALRQGKGIPAGIRWSLPIAFSRPSRRVQVVFRQECTAVSGHPGGTGKADATKPPAVLRSASASMSSSSAGHRLRQGSHCSPAPRHAPSGLGQ